MLLRHYRALHRPVPKHGHHERSAYGDCSDTVVCVVVLALTALAVIMGWLR